MVTGYSGDAGDAIRVSTQNIGWIANGKRFTTSDSDNDDCPCNCAGHPRYAGWWYSWCSTNLLNKDTNGLWTTGSPTSWNVQASRMLVKLN